MDGSKRGMHQKKQEEAVTKDSRNKVIHGSKALRSWVTSAQEASGLLHFPLMLQLALVACEIV